MNRMNLQNPLWQFFGKIHSLTGSECKYTQKNRADANRQEKVGKEPVFTTHRPLRAGDKSKNRFYTYAD